MNLIKREMEDYRILLRNIPSLVISLFIVSVIMMNLLANKEFVSMKYLALDCGFVLSWISFICMDMICKRFGAKAAAKISILAMFINLCVVLVFKLMSLTPGMWGEYYSTGMTEVNDALNTTFGGSWYVVLGSSTAMVCAAIWGIAQFVDNFVFATIVSLHFFGWTWTQVICCSITGAVMELLCEVVFSPMGYRVSENWEREQVGEQYIQYRAKAGQNA